MSTPVKATSEKTAETLTEKLQFKLSNPETASAFDLHAGVDEVLKEIGMTAADAGGKLTFFGQYPIVPSPIRFGTMAAIGLAAKTVAAAAIWRDRTGEGQDIHVDLRNAFRRFSGFFDGVWETMNGRPPAMGSFEGNPFLTFPAFHETRDGRHVMALNFYPQLNRRTLNFLRCSQSVESVNNAVLQWRADDLETAAAEQGLVLAKVRSNDYTGFGHSEWPDLKKFEYCCKDLRPCRWRRSSPLCWKMAKPGASKFPAVFRGDGWPYKREKKR